MSGVNIANNQLNCVMRLQPSPESIVYNVRIWLKTGKLPQSRIIDPKEIVRYNGEKPHHLYNRSKDGEERLCVFYPKWHEWNNGMLLAETYVPWVITWLNAYEYWQITGKWVYTEYIDRKK